MNSRRRFLLSIGAASTVGLAGCSTRSDSPVNETPFRSEVTPTQEVGYENGTRTNTPGPGTPTGEEQVTPGPDQDDDMDLTGQEIYFNWIHGGDEQVMNDVQGTDQETSISFEAVDEALEQGFEEGGRNQAVAEALETASQEYTPSLRYQDRTDTDTYEDRHKHILSALHQTLEQKNGSEWDFEVFSNMNYTQTVGETIQYSEIKIETGDTTENGETEYSIINAALNDDMNHSTHIPGEDKGNAGYKRTMSGVRNSANDVDLPPHDTEAIQNRIDRVRDEETDEEQAFASWAGIMGYQLFAGGHRVDSNVDYNPDQMLVPASQEIHERIDEVGYEHGDQVDENGDPLATHGRMDLQLAVNEKYFNEGYDQVEGPVVLEDLEETGDGWEFELREEPDWTKEDGYPAQAS